MQIAVSKRVVADKGEIKQESMYLKHMNMKMNARIFPLSASITLHTFLRVCRENNNDIIKSHKPCFLAYFLSRIYTYPRLYWIRRATLLVGYHWRQKAE